MIYCPHSLWSFSGSERRFVSVSKYLESDFGIQFESIESYPPLDSFLEIYHKTDTVKLSENVYINLIEWLMKGLVKILVLKRNRYDFVYANTNNIYNLLLGLIARKLLSLPLLVVVHHMRWIDYKETDKPFNFGRTYVSMRKRGLKQFDSLARTVGAAVENMFIKNSDAVITISKTVASQLRQIGYSKSVFLSGNGIDEKFLETAHNNSEENMKKFDAIYIGRLDEGKGTIDLVRMWRKVIDSIHNAKLVIVGRGVFYDRIKTLIEKECLVKNIQLMGYVDDNQLISLLRSSKVFVTLSLVEGWGLAIGEALACGLPVICYGIPPLRETFSSCKNVRFVQPGDVGQAAEEIAKFINEEKLQLGESDDSLVFPERFSWKEVARRECVAITSTITEAGR